MALAVKNPPANSGDIRDMGWEDPLEKGMETHSSILAWRISWTEKLGRLQPIALRSLEQRKVYCKVMQGDEVTYCPQKLEPRQRVTAKHF